jgi:hypothetical protein
VLTGRKRAGRGEVATKSSKTFTAWFFPVGADIAAIVTDWANYLRTEKLLGHNDPLFPSTRTVIGVDNQFEVQGLTRTGWSDGGPIRAIFREAFSRAGLPYFNPHSIRRTLVILGEQICGAPEDFKCWSRNLGHEEALTTFVS